MAILNVIIEDHLKERLDAEKTAQKRTIRALVEIALAAYFAQLEGQES